MAIGLLIRCGSTIATRRAERRTEDSSRKSQHRCLDEELPEDHAGGAPSALRSPISRVRSVTDTIMMFMTPIPPTSNDIAATPASRIVRVLLHRGGGGDQRLLAGDREVSIRRHGHRVMEAQ